jgi:hypothetical protein
VEGLFLFTKVEPHLAQIRAATSPRAFRNTEWVVANSPMGKVLMEEFRAKVKRMLDSKT